MQLNSEYIWHPMPIKPGRSMTVVRQSLHCSC